MASSRRKYAAIALAVVGVAGLSLASAAQLNVNTSSLGAGTDVVASCDTDGITVGFVNAYDAADEAYNTTDVTLGGVAAACDGLDLRITIADSAGASLGEITGEAATGDSSYALASAVSAESIVNVAVVIAG